MCVWRLGQTRIIGIGDFEDVRVERNSVLKECPQEAALEEAPLITLPSDDQARIIIRRSSAEAGGFLSQEKGDEIVRRIFPQFSEEASHAAR